MAVPSKMFEYMASGKPILLGCPDGEASNMLKSAGGALTYKASNAEQLAELIEKLRSGAIDGKTLGKGYHQYIRERHSRRKWGLLYLDIITQV